MKLHRWRVDGEGPNGSFRVGRTTYVFKWQAERELKKRRLLHERGLEWRYFITKT